MNCTLVRDVLFLAHLQESRKVFVGASLLQSPDTVHKHNKTLLHLINRILFGAKAPHTRSRSMPVVKTIQKDHATGLSFLA